MAKGVVIDNDITGWGKGKSSELSKTYEKIEYVGSPQIPRREPDEVIGLYCKKNDCDLLTADGEAYEHFFKAGITKVQISVYEWYEKGDKPIYFVRIIDQV